MLIQMHLLQSYAPANLNRDDTGAPKDAYFGGSRRGRISSQCLKRSIRKSEAFRQAFEAAGLLGMRTKRLPSLIRTELQALGADADTVGAILQRVPEIGRESAKASTEAEEPTAEQAPETTAAETRQLIFLGHAELRPLAEKLLALFQEHGAKQWPKVKINEITRHLGASSPRSVDIAMFGRMTTSEAFEDVAAAVQVAHALSTNALVQEFDYYTAVDDLSGESGAGMIGDVEFNCSTYYKYLNVHWEQLVDNLGGDCQVASHAVLALLEAAAHAQPSGKQNSFAAFSLPDLVLVEVTSANLPVSYANAFLKPVRPSGALSLMDASVAQLADYATRATRTFNLNGRRALTAVWDYQVADAEICPSLDDLKQWVAQLPE